MISRNEYIKIDIQDLNFVINEKINEIDKNIILIKQCIEVFTSDRTSKSAKLNSLKRKIIAINKIKELKTETKLLKNLIKCIL